jgi:hypothetical protein
MSTEKKIYIASMNRDHEWGQKIDPRSITVNVSGYVVFSSDVIGPEPRKNRRDFSPATQIKGDYMGYYELIKEREMTLHWKKALEKGKSITIYDFDGPRTEEGACMCLKVTEETIRERMNDSKHPFGHGYIIACAIAGIDPEVFCK